MGEIEITHICGEQDIMEERISTLEDKLTSIQVSLDLLPDSLARYHQGVWRNLFSMSICRVGGTGMAASVLYKAVQTYTYNRLS